MKKPIPARFIQENVDTQLQAAGRVFGGIEDLVEHANKREKSRDPEVRDFFLSVTKQLLATGEDLKRSATALGDKSVSSSLPLSLVKENLDEQFRSSQAIFQVVQNITKFAESRPDDTDLHRELQAPARDLVAVGEMLSASASDVGERLLRTIRSG
jgi:hypothetical protein